MKTQLYNELYRNLVSLASLAGVAEVDLQKYFVPEGNTSPESILFRLCSSLQNSGRMRNSIKFNDADPTYRNIIQNVLFDYDIKKSASVYPDWVSIYNAMIVTGIMDNGIKEKKESNWEKYCRGLYDGLHFLTADGGEKKINDLVAVSNLTDKELNDITAISKKIHGLGFALTCDWLKECGCSWLAKPDVHINGVVMYMQNDDNLKDEDVLKLMYSWAETVKATGDNTVTAYKIDKIIWLLCTGEFYLDGRKTGREAIYRKIDSVKET